MKRRKKDIPLLILKALEPIVNLDNRPYKFSDSTSYTMKVHDLDENSNFVFIIEKYRQVSSAKEDFQLHITQKPASAINIAFGSYIIGLSEIDKYFDRWVNLLAEYNSTNSFLDDPILQGFQEEYYSDFEIIDDDSETRPFTSAKILLLDDYLTRLDSSLDTFVTEENSINITLIKEDISLLKENLTTQSKKWVITKMSTIWAKITKQGTSFVRELLTESKKQLIKLLSKNTVDTIAKHGVDFIENL